MTSDGTTASPTSMRDGPSGPTVALALGGGSARGLAHIAILEALDELGVRPARIVGTSIGAIIGACAAAGLTGQEIREHARSMLSSRMALVRRVASRLPGNFTTLWSPRRPTIVDGVTLLELALPEVLRCDFASLAIPLEIVATDFYAMEQVVIDAGPVIPAVAASSALPSMMRPILRDGRVLIDGGFVNPTPYDIVLGRCDLTVAVDVSGVTQQPAEMTPPGSTEAWVGALHILFKTVLVEKLKQRPPDILVRPPVGAFGTLDFLQMDTILAATAATKEAFKRDLDARLNALCVRSPAQAGPRAGRMSPT